MHNVNLSLKVRFSSNVISNGTQHATGASVICWCKIMYLKFNNVFYSDDRHFLPDQLNDCTLRIGEYWFYCDTLEKILKRYEIINVKIISLEYL